MLHGEQWILWKKRIAVAVTCVGTLTVFSGCGDEQQGEVPSNPSADHAPALPERELSAAAPQPAEEAREALFEYMVYTCGKVMSDLAAAPEVNEYVKVMLEKLEAYYAAMGSTDDMSAERVRLALRMADVCRALSAFPKSESYYKAAEQDWEALPESVRNSEVGMRWQSSILNGLATCSLYTTGKYEYALKAYGQALELDKAIFEAVVPQSGPLQEAQVTPEVSAATCELLGSYRCLGDCLRRSGDSEEAREVYKSGASVAEKLGRLNPEMVVCFSRLLSDLGDLESSAGNLNEAVRYWTTCRQLLANANQASSKQHIKAETKRLHDTLTPLIQEVSSRLQSVQQEQAGAPNAPSDGGNATAGSRAGN